MSECVANTTMGIYEVRKAIDGEITMACELRDAKDWVHAVMLLKASMGKVVGDGLRTQTHCNSSSSVADE